MPYCYPGGMGPVRDFVRDVWKIGAACAAGAFLVSLVIGLIAGNPFGAVFLRALLFAVIFAGLGAGLRVVVKRYLPELVASNESTSGAAASGHAADSASRYAADSASRYAADSDLRGAAVDIVLPEDEGLRRHAYAGLSRADRTAPGQSIDAESDTDAEQAMDAESMDEDSTSQAEAQALGDLADELAEELPSAPDGLSPEAKEREAAAEELGPADESPRSSFAGDLDSLPDIAALEPSPGQGFVPGSARPARFSTTPERPGDAVRDNLSGQNPATLARALRTVLKKDEKG